MSTDEDCDETAPWNQWLLDGSDGPVTEREMLLNIAQLAAADAGKSVLHHLRLLTRAYPPDALACEGLDPNDVLKRHRAASLITIRHAEPLALTSGLAALLRVRRVSC